MLDGRRKPGYPGRRGDGAQKSRIPPRQDGGRAMRRAGWLLLLLALLPGPQARAADEAIRIELNAAEAVQNRCRLSFVIENKTDTAYESLKLDLVIFNGDGVIQRRVVAEMAPLRKAKTIVKAFEIDSECAQMGAVLVNDVTACTPGEAGACLDRLTLASKLKGVRFYK
jgi:hypothetical protein